MTRDSDPAAPTTSGPRHWLGFLGSGSFAFIVDASVLKLLTIVAGWPALPARVVSIFVATVAGWTAHRTFTFAVASRPTVAEFTKYLGVAWSAAVINYAIFACVLLLRPQTDTLIAIFISGVFAMVVSYLGMRFGAFRHR